MMAVAMLTVSVCIMCVFRKTWKGEDDFFQNGASAHLGIFWKPNEFIGSCSVLCALWLTLLEAHDIPKAMDKFNLPKPKPNQEYTWDTYTRKYMSYVSENLSNVEL